MHCMCACRSSLGAVCVHRPERCAREMHLDSVGWKRRAGKSAPAGRTRRRIDMSRTRHCTVGLQTTYPGATAGRPAPLATALLLPLARTGRQPDPSFRGRPVALAVVRQEDTTSEPNVPAHRSSGQRRCACYHRPALWSRTYRTLPTPGTMTDERPTSLHTHTGPDDETTIDLILISLRAS